jgi:REase_DpnII-MboI
MADVTGGLAKIAELKEELGSIPMKAKDPSVAFEMLRRWKERAVHEIRMHVSENEGAIFEKKRLMSFVRGNPGDNFVREAQLYNAHLQSLEHELKNNPEFILSRTAQKKIETKPTEPRDWLTILSRICSRFNIVARQMRARYQERPTLEVNDEYDVQDMLHALLRVDFEDIRAEEWTPSYAGGSSRMDFLLKDEQAVVEVKKTRSTLKEKDIGGQLLIDIQRYQEHPACKTLVCFIYDPEGLIGNPRGLINDLQKQSTDKIKVIVIINPM